MARLETRVREASPLMGDGAIEEIQRLALPLRTPSDLNPLIERIGEARFVLIGEASHGTSEYYTWRAALSERLIRERGFSFVAVEGDWPDCYRVNRYVKGYPDSGANAREVLHAFRRWPTWMWANWEVVHFVERLRRINDERTVEQKAGFYGLDVYSLWESLESILDYLRRVDPDALPSALNAFRCLEPYGEDAGEHARATYFVPQTYEAEVVQMLGDLRTNTEVYREDSREGYFNAEQNALVAKNAERYYRTMVSGGAASWNVRDDHMAETLMRLMEHHGPNARAIVWEHNTHIGDARATDMADEGMRNVGQIARQQRGDEGVVLVGFGSHHGSVIAGDEWDAPMEEMPVPPARDGSWEDTFHRAEAANELVIFPDERELDGLMDRRGHRAIGVVYHPHYERFGNYVPTVLPRRYDAFLYVDETHGLKPLHLKPRYEHEPPETFPWTV